MAARDTIELVARARAGDEAAWAVLVDQHRNVIWSAMASFRFDRATQDDVFQWTCLRLIDHLDSIREPERLAGWLWMVARRESLAMVKDRHRSSVHELDELPTTDPDVSERLVHDEELRAVLAALDELDERCQDLLRLLVNDPPLSYDEIAHALGVSIGYIGPTRARCLDKLRRRPSIVRISAARGALDTGEE